MVEYIIKDDPIVTEVLNAIVTEGYIPSAQDILDAWPTVG